MKSRTALFSATVLLGVVTALAPGCKPATCESVCEQQNTCEGAEPIPDCATYCDGQRTTAANTSCDDEYDAWLSCQGTVTSCDTASTFCTAQSVAYLQCVSDACAADPTKCSGG